MGEILKELPAVILRGSVLLPGVVSHFDISTQRSHSCRGSGDE